MAMSSLIICLIFILMLNPFAFGATSSSSDADLSLDKVKNWVTNKLGVLQRSYYDDHKQGGYGGGSYYEDDDDDHGLFGGGFGGGILGALITGALALGGLALLGSLLAPLLMLFTGGLGGIFGGGVVPTATPVIPTVTVGRRRRNAQAGIGAGSPQIKYSADLLNQLDNAIKKYEIEEGCRAEFLCSVHRYQLQNKLGEDSKAFADILRLDLSGVEKSCKIHEYKKAAELGMEGATSCRESQDKCKAVDAAIQKLAELKTN